MRTSVAYSLRLLLLLMPATAVWACSCGSWPSAREAWDDSPLVLIGRVEKTVRMVGSSYLGGNSLLQVVSVRVETPFKGAETGEVVTLREPVTSCTSTFRDGDRWLFYLHASSEPKTWTAMGCHRSRRLADAAGDLLFLRSLPESLKRSRLSGDVNLYEQSAAEGFQRQRPLSGVRVTIAGQGAVKEAFTNADGVYEVYGLPGGTYKVEVAVPPKMKVYFPMIAGRQNKRGREDDVILASDGASEVSFALIVDNVMSGRVLDPEGNPLKNACLQLEPSGKPASRHFYITGCSKEEGRFVLNQMPSGSYLLVLNKSGTQTGAMPFPTLYYPGTTEKEKATVVTIGEGEHLEGLDIRVPAMARRVRISGRMQFNDGKGVPSQSVRFAGGDYVEYTKTAEDGTFQFTVLADRAGEVHGEMMVDRATAAKCPSFKINHDERYLHMLKPPPAMVTTKEDQTGVLLTFPFASCSEWRK